MWEGTGRGTLGRQIDEEACLLDDSHDSRNEGRRKKITNP
jgi:hypothetical protein